MDLTMRRMRSTDEFWAIRSFLQQVMLLNDLHEGSWHVARLDYWRWHGIENCGMDPFMENTLIWETPQGKIAAVLNPENRNSFYFQVHPAHRSTELYGEMVAAAEYILAKPDTQGRIGLRVHAHEDDWLLESILEREDYTLTADRELENRRDLSREIPGAPIPDGFIVRQLGDAGELPARSWASWRGFHPDEPDEKYEGWEWYRNIRCCPLYRQDLDIVAVAPNGEIASFCTIWYDEFTRTAYYEPVATPPEYQRKGLARACMIEGMRRLKLLGCVRAFVASEEPHADHFYHSIGFDEHDVLRAWDKK